MANDYFNLTTPLSEHTLARGKQINDIFTAVQAGFALLPAAGGFTNNLAGFYADDSVAANTILLTPSPILGSYVQGAMVRWKQKIANTGPCVMNISSLGNVSFVRNDGTALKNGDLPINSTPVAIFSGTVFFLISSSAIDVTAAAGYAAAASASATAAAASASAALAAQLATVGLVSAHAALTATHGVAGAIVGTSDAQALTNKTINASNNTLSNIPNAALTNNGVTIGGVTIALGGAGLAAVENKSSATIRGELTKANIDSARGMTVAGVISGTAANSGRISWGTGAPGALAEGEIYFRYP